MGLHICLYDKDGYEEPEWDFIRQLDDRKIYDIIGDYEVEGDDFYNYPSLLYVKDFNKMKTNIEKICKSEESKKRYYKLMNFLKMGHKIHISH